MALLSSTKPALEKQISKLATTATARLVSRGSQFAIKVEGKINAREYIDRELRNAIDRSQMADQLIEADPSYVAWF